jgi:hypothetical protein
MSVILTKEPQEKTPFKRLGKLSREDQIAHDIITQVLREEFAQMLITTTVRSDVLNRRHAIAHIVIDRRLSLGQGYAGHSQVKCRVQKHIADK